MRCFLWKARRLFRQAAPKKPCSPCALKTRLPAPSPTRFLWRRAPTPFRTARCRPRRRKVRDSSREALPRVRRAASSSPRIPCGNVRTPPAIQADTAAQIPRDFPERKMRRERRTPTRRRLNRSSLKFSFFCLCNSFFSHSRSRERHCFFKKASSSAASLSEERTPILNCE